MQRLYPTQMQRLYPTQMQRSLPSAKCNTNGKNAYNKMDKFQNKYRIPSARLQSWDYRWAGAYFITICTAGRAHYFGEIVSGKFVPSHMGIIANVLWTEIPHHMHNIQLGAFVVMPNHIHGILVLENNSPSKICKNDGNLGNNPVETLHATSLIPNAPKTKNEYMAGISPKPNSISTIIRSYKSAVSKHAHRLGFNFQWQSRFYDNIIRNDAQYQRIVGYINANPENWEQDKFYKIQEL